MQQKNHHDQEIIPLGKKEVAASKKRICIDNLSEMNIF